MKNVTDRAEGWMVILGEPDIYAKFKWWGNRDEIECNVYTTQGDKKYFGHFAKVLGAKIKDYKDANMRESVSSWGMF